MDLILVNCINVWGRADLVAFEKVRGLAILRPLIGPLGVRGCKISWRSYSSVERCYVQHEPSYAAVSDELEKLGWQRKADYYPQGELLGAWCKGDQIISIAKDEADWIVEFDRAVAYSCKVNEL
jgi:hypothetical protein